MQETLSISIGSSPRDQSVEISPLGEKVHRQRVVLDGNLQTDPPIARIEIMALPAIMPKGGVLAPMDFFWHARRHLLAGTW